jgi:hypothetical protein
VFTTADPAGSSEGSLLQAEPGVLATGRWLWQSDDDVYAVNRFLVTVGPAGARIPAGPSTLVEWAAFGGGAQVRDATSLVPGTTFAGGKPLDPATSPPESLRLSPPPADAGAPAALFEPPRLPPPPATPAVASPRARPSSSSSSSGKRPPEGQPF